MDFYLPKSMENSLPFTKVPTIVINAPSDQYLCAFTALSPPVCCILYQIFYNMVHIFLNFKWHSVFFISIPAFLLLLSLIDILLALQELLKQFLLASRYITSIFYTIKSSVSFVVCANLNLGHRAHWKSGHSMTFVVSFIYQKIKEDWKEWSVWSSNNESSLHTSMVWAIEP